MVQKHRASCSITPLRNDSSLTVGLACLVSVCRYWIDLCLVWVRTERARIRWSRPRIAFSLTDRERSADIPAFDRNASHILLDPYNDTEHP